MTQIPTALGIYEDMDGNRLAKYESGRDKWLMVSASSFTSHMKQLSCSFASDEEVAEHLPLKRISNEKAKEER